MQGLKHSWIPMCLCVHGHGMLYVISQLGGVIPADAKQSNGNLLKDADSVVWLVLPQKALANWYSEVMSQREDGLRATRSFIYGLRWCRKRNIPDLLDWLAPLNHWDRPGAVLTHVILFHELTKGHWWMLSHCLSLQYWVNHGPHTPCCDGTVNILEWASTIPGTDEEHLFLNRPTKTCEEVVKPIFDWLCPLPSCLCWATRQLGPAF